VREVVIIAVAAVWGADYALYAHCAVARKAGLSDDDVTNTCPNAGIPDDLSEHEKIAARLAHQLSTSHHVDDELYREAEKSLRYNRFISTSPPSSANTHTVCTALTLFDVPAPV